MFTCYLQSRLGYILSTTDWIKISAGDLHNLSPIIHCRQSVCIRGGPMLFADTRNITLAFVFLVWNWFECTEKANHSFSQKMMPFSKNTVVLIQNSTDQLDTRIPFSPPYKLAVQLWPSVSRWREFFVLHWVISVLVTPQEWQAEPTQWALLF